MPVLVLSDAGPVKVYTCAEIDSLRINSQTVTGASAGMKSATREVTGGTWTADTNPPVEPGETWYYADLEHMIGSDLAHVVIGIGADDVLLDRPLKQQAKSTAKLRIWCNRNFPYNTRWLIAG